MTNDSHDQDLNQDQESLLILETEQQSEETDFQTWFEDNENEESDLEYLETENTQVAWVSLDDGVISSNQVSSENQVSSDEIPLTPNYISPANENVEDISDLLQQITLPMCRFFIPSRDMEGASAPPNYNFSSLPANPSCNCPSLTGSVNIMTTCDFYAPDIMSECGGSSSDSIVEVCSYEAKLNDQTNVFSVAKIRNKDAVYEYCMVAWQSKQQYFKFKSFPANRLLVVSSAELIYELQDCPDLPEDLICEEILNNVKQIPEYSNYSFEKLPPISSSFLKILVNSGSDY